MNRLVVAAVLGSTLAAWGAAPPPRAAGRLTHKPVSLQEVQTAVARTKVNPGNRAALKVLIAAVEHLGDDPEPGVGLSVGPDDVHPTVIAVNRLGEMGPAAKEAIPALARLMRKKDRAGWYLGRAASALSRIGEDAIPALTATLKEKRRELREEAVLALGRIGPAAARKEVLAALEDALKEKDIRVRGAAVRAVGQMGPGAGRLAPRLRTLLRDPEDDIRMDIALSLWQITGRRDESLPVLIAGVNGPNGRERAAQCLRVMGKEAKEAVPA
jgi:HEAT repeat protein